MLLINQLLVCLMDLIPHIIVILITKILEESKIRMITEFGATKCIPFTYGKIIFLPLQHQGCSTEN